MKTKKRSLRGRIAPLAIAGTTLISGFMPLISNAGVWAAPVDPINYVEGMLLTLTHVDMNTMLDIDATSDGGFIVGGPFYQQNIGLEDESFEFAIGSSLAKYNASSEVEWNQKVSEFRIGNDPELQAMLYGNDDHMHSSLPVIKSGNQSFILMPNFSSETETLEFMCIDRSEFIDAYHDEREPETTSCPELSVGLIYSIKQTADGGYAGLSGGFSSLADFYMSIENGISADGTAAENEIAGFAGIIGGFDSSLVKFDTNGNKVWSTVVTGEVIANALDQEFRNQGLIANDDEAILPSMALIKDLIPLSDGGYVTSGASVSIYGNEAVMGSIRGEENDSDEGGYGAIGEEEDYEVKIIYSGVLEKFNSEGSLVGIKTYASKVLSSDQLRSLSSRGTIGVSDDLEDWRLIRPDYNTIYPDDYPEGHFYCRYDDEDHYGDPDYIEHPTGWFTECRENDYLFVRMLDLRRNGISRGDDPIKTEEYLNFYRELLTIGALTLPTQTTPTSDGGVVIAGAELNIGVDLDDMLSGTIIKFDGSLNQQWTYKVTDEARRFSAFRDVVETADGGFVAVGLATKLTPISSYIVKVDANGNKVWDKLWLDDETGAIASAAIGVTELTTGQVVVIGANFEDIKFDNIVALGTAVALRDIEYITENIGSMDDIFDFDGYILVLDGITGEKALSQTTPRVNSKVTRMSNGKLVIINMDTSSNQPGAPIQLIADATIIDLSDVLPNNGGNNGDDDYSDITVPNTGVSNEIAQVPLILGAITMAAPFILKMMSRARKHGKAASFNK